jgi:hypothetical protein
VRMDEVREVFGKWLGAIRNLMDAMPSSLAAEQTPPTQSVLKGLSKRASIKSL